MVIIEQRNKPVITELGQVGCYLGRSGCTSLLLTVVLHPYGPLSYMSLLISLNSWLLSPEFLLLRINRKLKSSKLTNFGFNQKDYSYSYNFATIVCMLFRTGLLVPKARYRYSAGDIPKSNSTTV